MNYELKTKILKELKFILKEGVGDSLDPNQFSRYFDHDSINDDLKPTYDKLKSGSYLPEDISAYARSMVDQYVDDNEFAFLHFSYINGVKNCLNKTQNSSWCAALKAQENLGNPNSVSTIIGQVRTMPGSHQGQMRDTIRHAANLLRNTSYADLGTTPAPTPAPAPSPTPAPTPAPAPSPTPAPAESSDIDKGTYVTCPDDSIVIEQQWLKYVKKYKNLVVDGKYGKYTHAAMAEINKETRTLDQVKGVICGWAKGQREGWIKELLAAGVPQEKIGKVEPKKVVKRKKTGQEVIPASQEDKEAFDAAAAERERMSGVRLAQQVAASSARAKSIDEQKENYYDSKKMKEANMLFEKLIKKL